MNNILKMVNRSSLIRGHILSVEYLAKRITFEPNLLKKKYTSICEPKDYKLEFNEHKNKIENMDLNEVNKYVNEKEIFGDEIKKIVTEKKYNEMMKIIKIEDDVLPNEEKIKKWIEENLEINELKYFFENEFYKFENEKYIFEFLIENYTDYIDIATLLSNKNLTKNNSKIYFSKIRNKMNHLKDRKNLKLLPSSFYDLCDEETLITITSANNFDVLIKEINWENNLNLFRKIYDKIIEEAENHLKKLNFFLLHFLMNLNDNHLIHNSRRVDDINYYEKYKNINDTIEIKYNSNISKILNMLFGTELYEFNKEKLNGFILKCLLKNKNNKLDDVLTFILDKDINENEIHSILELEIYDGKYETDKLKILLKKINIDKLDSLKNKSIWLDKHRGKLNDRLVKFEEIIDNEKERRKIYGQ